MSSEPKEIQTDSEKDQFKDILAFIEKTDLEYVEIERKGKKIMLKRSAHGVPSLHPQMSEAELAQAEEDKGPKHFMILSPIVGRFHSSMGSDRPALVVEGSHITAGQRVAIVEAMKIKKEVFSAVTGKVVKINVNDGDAVEYGQELFKIEVDEPETEQ